MGKEGRIWNPSPFMEPFSVSYFIYDFSEQVASPKLWRSWSWMV
jgi:hypothetical protein